MSSRHGRPERRSDERVSPKGTVIVRASTYIIRGRIGNVCRHGLFATTEMTAPERLLGSPAIVEVRLDSGASNWSELTGQILRIGANTLALRLEVVPPPFLRVIEETLTASNFHQRVLSIVLVDATPERRTQMSDAFRAAGCAVIDVSTPLEAIVRLGESHFEPDLIAIADSLPTRISDELRRFVDTAHPNAKLVAIGEAGNAPAGLAHWLADTNPGGDLAARVRKVLTTFNVG